MDSALSASQLSKLIKVIEEDNKDDEEAYLINFKIVKLQQEKIQ